jgi:transcriptional regulator with XRE-family HTH domain
LNLQTMARIRNEKFIKALGNRVREVRLRKGITMEALADIAGSDYQQISRAEGGKVNATVSTLYPIALALEVPLSELFDVQIGQGGHWFQKRVCLVRKHH